MGSGDDAEVSNVDYAMKSKEYLGWTKESLWLIKLKIYEEVIHMTKLQIYEEVLYFGQQISVRALVMNKSWMSKEALGMKRLSRNYRFGQAL